MIAAIVAGAVVALVGVLYLVGYVMAGDKLPEGGLRSRGWRSVASSTEEATQKLQTELGDRATAPIAVTAGDEEDTVVPADAGLSVDWAASVELAGGGRSLDPRHIWRVLTGGSQTDAGDDTDSREAGGGRGSGGEERRP